MLAMLPDKAGHRLSLQYHEVKELCMSPQVFSIFMTARQYYQIEADERFHVRPHQIHRFGANESNVEIMESKHTYILMML